MAGDILWDYVSLLMGFEGASGAVDFEDEGPVAHTLTNAGDRVVANTSIFAAGSSSGYFDGSNTRITAPRDDSFRFGGEDFTVEAMFYRGSFPTFNVLIDFWKMGGTDGWRFVMDGTDLVFWHGGGGTYTTRSATMTGAAANTQYHIAAMRLDDVLYLLFNGQVLNSWAITGSISNPDADLYIGGSSTFTLDYAGYLDELRITKAARYPEAVGSSTYTVPELPFERGPLSAGSPIPGAENNTITLACFLKWELPERNVLLADGGLLSYSSETYQSEDVSYGAIYSPSPVDAQFGDMAETGQVVLAPQGEAAVADWWRDDLHDTRLRIWMGNVDSDGYTVSSATLLADMVVDTYERQRNDGGSDLLAMDLIGRAEKLFLTNEGNVLSQRFHQSVFSGENGMNNCTDLTGYLAWGAATPPRGSLSGGGSSTPTPFYLSRTVSFG